jgi:hypothetical protein
MTANGLSVEETAFPGQQVYDGEPFPLVLACLPPAPGLDRALAWVGAHRGELIVRVERVGAILFRGFPVVTDRDFDAFVAAFGLAEFPYEDSLSNAVRVSRTPRVFTANEAPPSVTIRLHHELAQTPTHPAKLFLCETAATFALAVPTHDRLQAAGLDRGVVAGLVAGNGVRTVAWTLAFLLLLAA